MNKFKVGDIVLATGIEVRTQDNGKLFTIIEIIGNSTIKIQLLYYKRISHYYTYKFEKVSKNQIEQYKFKYIVSKLKGELINE